MLPARTLERAIMAPIGRATVRSAHRQPVLQAALGPQRIEPARDLERRALAYIAIETLTVIADVLDDAVGPIVGQSERLPELAFNAKQPPHFRIGRFELLVDVALG